MSKIHFEKYISRFSKTFAFLFVLVVFFFSLYKISPTFALGVTYDDCYFDCGECFPKANCNESCFCVGCKEGLECYRGVCRNPECLEEEDCVCPTPTPTPPPEPTPTPPPGPSPTPPPGPPGPPVCGASTPNAPTLLSATKSGANTDLSWTAVDPATHYSISYGPSSGNYIYGVDNTGSTTFFTVGGLDPASDYCFAVRAVNDCAPSELSNEICTGAVLGVGQVLGVTTLAETGDLTDDLFYILFIIGSICVGIGLRLFLPCPAKPAFGERSGTAKRLV